MTARNLGWNEAVLKDLDELAKALRRGEPRGRGEAARSMEVGLNDETGISLEEQDHISNPDSDQRGDSEESKEGLYIRCRERSLYLLTDSERSERNLRDKLLKSGKYSVSIVDRVIAFLKEYGYLDDRRLAEHILECCRGEKSIREIEKKMYERGISQGIICEVISEYRDEDCGGEELEAARALIRRKTSDVASLDPGAKKKLFAYLMRKGFPYETVTKALQVDEE